VSALIHTDNHCNMIMYYWNLSVKLDDALLPAPNGAQED
jgi:hypothetical protein